MTRETKLRARLQETIEGFDNINDDQRQCLVDAVLSEIQPTLNDLRIAHREHGRVSTRLYLARLELKETQSRLRRMSRNANSSGQHWSRMIRLLRDLMHAIDPSMIDGPLDKDLDHCIRLAQQHRHVAINTNDSSTR